MAHPEQIEFCKKVKELYPSYFNDVFVLDAGSLDVNGNNQYLFEDSHYLGIDIGEGKNVDIVQKAHELKLPDNTFDIVISTEVFEHDMYYQESIKNLYRMLKPGGMFLFTCATTGRPEHGTRSSEPESAPLLQNVEEWEDYYKNLDENDIKLIFESEIEKYFYKYQFSVNIKSHDLYFWGIKDGVFFKRNDRSHNLSVTDSNAIEKEVELLKTVADIAMFDEAYYFDKYHDAHNFKDGLKAHYYQHGKVEKRFPNQYCEYYNVDTSELISLDEKNFVLNNDLENLQKDITETREKNAYLDTEIQSNNKKLKKYESDIESLNSQVNSVVGDLKLAKDLNTELKGLLEISKHDVTEARRLIADLETELHTKDEILTQKESDIEELNSQIDAVVADFAAVKEDKAVLSDSLESTRHDLTEARKQTADLETEIHSKNEILNQHKSDIGELNKKIGSVVAELAIVKEDKAELEISLENTQHGLSESREHNAGLETDIASKHQYIEHLEGELQKLEKNLLDKTIEIDGLSTLVSEIVGDLATIKESKCWIYTKPIRKLQSFIVGKE